MGCVDDSADIRRSQNAVPACSGSSSSTKAARKEQVCPSRDGSRSPVGSIWVHAALFSLDLVQFVLTP